jgi:hypothetical protein
MRPEEVTISAPVEWRGPHDSRVGLWPGHPGRIQDPSPGGVFVEWVGLEYGMASRVSYDRGSLAAISDVEFACRAARVLRGESPCL